MYRLIIWSVDRIERKIGNDETHYYKKYEEWDIDNLKDFINSAQTYIFSDYNYLLSQKLLR